MNVTSRHLLAIVAVISLAMTIACMLAWIQAVRRPDYANYWEWRDGWRIGASVEGSDDHPAWYAANLFLDHFPPTPAAAVSAQREANIPYDDILTYPDNTWLVYTHQRQMRILWPLFLSLVAPIAWAVSRFRTVEFRGFPVGTLSPPPGKLPL